MLSYSRIPMVRGQIENLPSFRSFIIRHRVAAKDPLNNKLYNSGESEVQSALRGESV
jgi:hypothetical protein